MAIKDFLKNSIEGTGEVTEALMTTTAKVVKEGAHDISDIFGAIIDLGKEGVVDITEGVKGVFLGSVNALKESGKTTEEAASVVTVKAEQAIGKIGKAGEETIGSAAKKGVEEAKKVIKEPFKSNH